MASTIATTIISNTASITAFNRGPIPTAFSAPASCLSTLTSVNGHVLYYGHDGGDYLDPSCYPTATLSSTGWDLYYYSPVVSCPSGWYTASTATSSFGGFSSLYLSIGSETTVALCCPSGYNALDYDHQCVSTFPLGTNTILYKNPSQTINGNWVVPTSLGTATYIAALPSSTSTTSYWTVFGDGIPIWHEASDLSSPTPTQTSTTATSTNTNPASATSSTPPATSTGSSGLSTGAKAGIGIGAALVVLAIAGLVGWCLLRRRKRYNTVDQAGSPVRELDSMGPVRELGAAAPPEKRKSELPAQEVLRPEVHELYSDDGVPAQHRGVDNGPREMQ